jgi:hypothetical protein
LVKDFNTRWGSGSERVFGHVKDFNTRWGSGSERVFGHGGTVSHLDRNHQVGIHPLIVLATALDPRKKSLEAISGCFSDSDTDEIWKVLEENMVPHFAQKGQRDNIKQTSKEVQDSTGCKEKQEEREEAMDLMTPLLIKKKEMMEVSDPDVTERGKSVEVQCSEEL